LIHQLLSHYEAGAKADILSHVSERGTGASGAASVSLYALLYCL